MNKKISTPIVIIITAILVVAVGGFALWQRQETTKEENKPLLEVQIPEKEREAIINNCSDIKFENYPISETYKGKIAEVNFESSPDYYKFYTVITNEAKNGPNFAGKYTIVTWGCGAPCQNNIIIDSQTGNILDGFFSAWGSDYKIDSTLIISDVGAYEGTAIQYFEFNNNELNLICEKK